MLDAIAAAAEAAAAPRPTVTDAPLALVRVPDVEAAIELANAYAPEHLELLESDAALLADRVTNRWLRLRRPPRRHRLRRLRWPAPTTCCRPAAPVAMPARSARRLSPPHLQRRDRRRAAAALAPHVDALARAEGFPVHGESAMIRSKS